MNRITHQTVASAAGLAALLALAACEPQRLNTPTVAAPAAEPVKGSAPDPSLPAAGSVVSPPTSPTAQDTGKGRADVRMTREQESSAMPMPGQANDHSTSPAASAPQRGAVAR